MTAWNSPQERDAYFMRKALQEAVRGQGRTAPNPLVGCVLVKDDRIIGRGHHACAGTPHAEAHALANATERVQGAEVFVTLEPCAHHGRTPPCAQALRDHGVARVVAGMIDPDPRVQGRGMQILQDAGIETTVGVLEDACRQINEAFIIRMRHHRPHVTLKLAGSLDGRIATFTGDSQWLTCEASRRRVHQTRNRVDAILIGAGTAIADQPNLTTRLPDLQNTRSPHRYILDSTLRTPIEGPLFETALAHTTFVCTDAAPQERQSAFEGAGVEVLRLPQDPDAPHVPLRPLLKEMYARGHMELMVEGGAQIAGAFLDARLIDRLMLFVAPILLGGKDAYPLVAGQGVAMVADALRATDVRYEQIEKDLLIHAVFDDTFHA